MQVAIRRKTSFEVDFSKVEAAQQILGTTTLTETVDKALAEIVNIQKRQRLAEMLFSPGLLDLDDPEIMRDAWA